MLEVNPAAVEAGIAVNIPFMKHCQGANDSLLWVDSPVLSAPVESDIRGDVVARVRVEAVDLVEHSRPRDVLVQLIDSVWRPIDNSGAGIDDSFDIRPHGLYRNSQSRPYPGPTS